MSQGVMLGEAGRTRVPDSSDFARRSAPAQADATMHRMVGSIISTLQHEVTKMAGQMYRQEQMFDFGRRQRKAQVVRCSSSVGLQSTNLGLVLVEIGRCAPSFGSRGPRVGGCSGWPLGTFG